MTETLPLKPCSSPRGQGRAIVRLHGIEDLRRISKVFVGALARCRQLQLRPMAPELLSLHKPYLIVPVIIDRPGPRAMRDGTHQVRIKTLPNDRRLAGARGLPLGFRILGGCWCRCFVMIGVNILGPYGLGLAEGTPSQASACPPPTARRDDSGPFFLRTQRYSI